MNGSNPLSILKKWKMMNFEELPFEHSYCEVGSSRSCSILPTNIRNVRDIIIWFLYLFIPTKIISWILNSDANNVQFWNLGVRITVVFRNLNPHDEIIKRWQVEFVSTNLEEIWVPRVEQQGSVTKNSLVVSPSNDSFGNAWKY